MPSQHLYRTDAIVLRRHDLGEADRVLTLYGPQIGKFRAVAKGVRRPKSRLGGHVELFTHTNVLVAQGRNLDIVTQAETVRPFPRLRDDLWKAAYASYAAELVDRFTEERLDNAPVFELLREMLVYLDTLEVPVDPGVLRESAATNRSVDAAADIELAARSYELHLLGHLGYAPELHHCVGCTKRLEPGQNRYSPAEGGVICAACSDDHPGAHHVSVNAIKAMRLLAGAPFGIFQRLRLTSEVRLEIEGALRAHVNYVLEKQLRTAEFLDRMKADLRRERRAS